MFSDTIIDTTFDMIQGIDGTGYEDTFTCARHCTPEQELMLAVLKDGLLSYRRTLRKPIKLTYDDREWFFGSERKPGLFSFESVCTVLELSAQRIRKHLLDWEKQTRSNDVIPPAARCSKL
jgi:hypothetical protein